MPIRTPQKRLVLGTNAQQELGSVVCEYDAIHASTYYTSGDQISTLYATNGSVANATNAGAAGTKPTFLVNAFGTKPGFKFVEASNQVIVPPATFPTGAKTIAFVARLDSLPTSGDLFGLITLSTGTAGAFEMYFSNHPSYINFIFRCDGGGVTNGVGYNLTLDTNPHVFVITYNGGTVTSAASYTLSIDSVPVTVATTGAFNAGTATSSLGVRPEGTWPSNATLGSLVVIKGALSAFDVLRLSRSMAQAFEVTTA